MRARAFTQLRSCHLNYMYKVVMCGGNPTSPLKDNHHLASSAGVVQIQCLAGYLGLSRLLLLGSPVWPDLAWGPRAFGQAAGLAISWRVQPGLPNFLFCSCFVLGRKNAILLICLDNR